MSGKLAFYSSRRIRRKSKKSRSLVFVIALLFAVAVSGWGSPDLRPSWKLAPIPLWDDNLSLLSDLKRGSGNTSGSLDQLMEGGWVDEKRVEYDRITREYESRKQHGLSVNAASAEQGQRMRALTEQVLDQLRIQNFVRQRDLLTKNLKSRLKLDFGGWSGLFRQSAAIAGFFTAIGTGTPLFSEFARDAKLTAYTNIPYRTSYLQLNSPLFDSTLTYVSGPPHSLPFETPKPPDWINRNERYVVQASRGLPIWGLGSSLSYGGTSLMVTGSLSKQITPHLTAAVDASVPTDPMRSASKVPHETVRINYDVKF